jgi:hypothetical protein
MTDVARSFVVRCRAFATAALDAEVVRGFAAFRAVRLCLTAQGLTILRLRLRGIASQIIKNVTVRHSLTARKAA